jgi:hypothetical protein
MIIPTNEQSLLLELVRATGGISVSGTPVRLLDTRLNRAIIDAENYLRRHGIDPTATDRPVRPVRPSQNSEKYNPSNDKG